MECGTVGEGVVSSTPDIGIGLLQLWVGVGPLNMPGCWNRVGELEDDGMLKRPGDASLLWVTVAEAGEGSRDPNEKVAPGRTVAT